MRINLIFNPYDFFIGIRINKDDKKLYVFLIPTVGIIIQQIKRYRAGFAIVTGMHVFWPRRVNPTSENDWREGYITDFNYALSSVIVTNNGESKLLPMSSIYTERFYVK